MISALGWIRRDAVAKTPTKYTLTEADYETFMEHANAQISKAHNEAGMMGIDLQGELDRRASNNEGEASDVEMTQDAMEMEEAETAEVEVETVEMSKEEAEELSKYNLDDYDDEGKDDDSSSDEEEEEKREDSDAIFTPLDRLIKVKKGEEGGEDEEMADPEDLDDLTIRSSDVLVVAARTEDELSHLEVYVYEEAVEVIDEVTGKKHTEDNLYVHHDVMISTFPLCLEWINYSMDSSKPSNGNFVAVGTFEPQIEIWNLDVLEAVYPAVTLGNGHKDAVMSLSWNKQAGNFLLSGSADKSVLLWDLKSAGASPSGPLRSFNHHTDKVQAVQWHPKETSIIASGGYDRQVIVFDARAPTDHTKLLTGLKGDVESVKWNPNDSNSLVVTDETGRVTFMDPRNPMMPVFILDAHHAKPCTTLDFCSLRPDSSNNQLFLTASTDKTVKIWSYDGAGAVNCLLSKDVGVGKVFTAGFCPDAPLIVSAAGSKGLVQMWNLKKEDVVTKWLSS